MGRRAIFGHLAYEVDDIYALCERLMQAGVTINRPPRDGQMAFVRSPDRHSIELLQKGEPLPAARALEIDAEYRKMVRRRSACRCPPSTLYLAGLRALRLAVQDAALSRRKHGFEFP